MAWAAILSLVGLMTAALVILGTASVPVLSVGLPILGVVVGTYVGTDKGWGIYTPPKDKDGEPP